MFTLLYFKHIETVCQVAVKNRPSGSARSQTPRVCFYPQDILFPAITYQHLLKNPKLKTQIKTYLPKISQNLNLSP